MLSSLLYRYGLRAEVMQASSMGAVGLCIGLWIRAKTVDQDERGNALARHEATAGARIKRRFGR